MENNSEKDLYIREGIKGGHEKNTPPTTPTGSATGNQILKQLSVVKMSVLKELYNEGKRTKFVKRIAHNMGYSNGDTKTVRTHLFGLQQLKLVERDSPTSVWWVSDLGVSMILGGEKTLVVSEVRGGHPTPEWLKPRSHNIKIKVKVHERPSRKDWLESWIPNDSMKNNIFYSKKFGDIGMTYTGSNIIFQLPILNFKSTDDALAEGYKIADALSLRLEDDVEGLKFGGRKVTAQVISQHHALVNDPFAKWMVKNGITYSDGTLDVDSSQQDELEFTDPSDAHLHTTRYIKHIKNIAENDLPTMGELTKIVYGGNVNVSELANSHKLIIEAILNTQKQLDSLTKHQKIAIERLEIESRNGEWKRYI